MILDFKKIKFKNYFYMIEELLMPLVLSLIKELSYYKECNTGPWHVCVRRLLKLCFQL